MGGKISKLNKHVTSNDKPPEANFSGGSIFLCDFCYQSGNRDPNCDICNKINLSLCYTPFSEPIKLNNKQENKDDLNFYNNTQLQQKSLLFRDSYETLIGKYNCCGILKQENCKSINIQKKTYQSQKIYVKNGNKSNVLKFQKKKFIKSNLIKCLSEQCLINKKLNAQEINFGCIPKRKLCTENFSKTNLYKMEHKYIKNFTMINKGEGCLSLPNPIFQTENNTDTTNNNNKYLINKNKVNLDNNYNKILSKNIDDTYNDTILPDIRTSFIESFKSNTDISKPDNGKSLALQTEIEHLQHESTNTGSSLKLTTYDLRSDKTYSTNDTDMNISLLPGTSIKLNFARTEIELPIKDPITICIGSIDSQCSFNSSTLHSNHKFIKSKSLLPLSNGSTTYTIIDDEFSERTINSTSELTSDDNDYLINKKISQACFTDIALELSRTFDEITNNFKNDQIQNKEVLVQISQTIKPRSNTDIYSECNSDQNSNATVINVSMLQSDDENNDNKFRDVILLVEKVIDELIPYFSRNVINEFKKIVKPVFFYAFITITANLNLAKTIIHELKINNSSNDQSDKYLSDLQSCLNKIKDGLCIIINEESSWKNFVNQKSNENVNPLIRSKSLPHYLLNKFD